MRRIATRGAEAGNGEAGQAQAAAPAGDYAFSLYAG